MCTCQQDRKPIPIDAGTPLPLRIPVFGQVGKRPIVTVNIRNVDGTETSAPLVTHTYEYDAEGFCTAIFIDDADGGGGVAADNLNVDIYPQNRVCI
jgi:YD repeat-containing protein